MWRVALLSIAALACASPSATLPDPEPLAGLGARPLTDSVAAAWFIARVHPGATYEMALVVFLIGEPGWIETTVQHDSSTSPTAFWEFVLPKGTLRVDLDRSHRTFTVAGETVPLAEANVAVVSGLGSGSHSLERHELLDLVVPFESDPIREVVAQSEALQALFDPR